MLLSPRELLRLTIALYQKEFWLFLGYAAWLLVPVAAYFFAVSLPANPVTTVLIIATTVLQVFVWLWIIVCLMRATALLTMNKTIDHDVLSTQSLRRIQPLLVVLLLQVLIVLGGLLLLVVPGIIFWVWYAMAQVATGLDDIPAIESLTTSRALVRGRFSQVLWRLLSGPLVVAILYAFLSGAILLLLSQLLGVDFNLLWSDTPPLWGQLIQSIIDIFFIPLFIIYSVLLYQDLKKNPLEKSDPLT